MYVAALTILLPHKFVNLAKSRFFKKILRTDQPTELQTDRQTYLQKLLLGARKTICSHMQCCFSILLVHLVLCPSDNLFCPPIQDKSFFSHDWSIVCLHQFLAYRSPSHVLGIISMGEPPFQLKSQSFGQDVYIINCLQIILPRNFYTNDANQ